MNPDPSKIRVAVLYGGRSGEHEVSLLSATNVIQHLDRTRFEVIPIGIDKQGTWFLGETVFHHALTSPTPLLRLNREQEKMLFNPNSIGKALPISHLHHTSSAFDVVFPVMHGPLCEDGTIQGLLELTELPYVGCGVLASAIGMDKDFSKRLVAQAGMRVPAYVTLKQSDWHIDPKKCVEKIHLNLDYPVFVKPANTGSSVGVEKAKNEDQLNQAIQQAFQYDTKVIIEQGLRVREIEVAVLESLDYGADPIVSPPGEIKPATHHEFYSYASKYLDAEGASVVIPAELSKDLQEKIQRMAKDIFKVLECEGLARIDLFLEEETNDVYFNEINSLPGFTSISMYPKLMMATGLSYTDILTHLIQLAMDRSVRKKQLSREYVAHSTL